MEYRTVGRSGLRVSVIGLGSWLTYGRSVDEGTAHACLCRAYERGVNFFDTADVYASGAAEKTLGGWLSDVPRSSVVIATKAFFPMGDGPNDRGLSRKHVMESCEASLRRLGTDYVDLYQCHRYDGSVPLEETLRALDDLTTQGKILYAGVSEWSAEQLQAAVDMQRTHGWHPLIGNQPQYSLLARRIEERVLPTSNALGIGQVVWSPLAGGVLTGKYRPHADPPPGSRGADPAARQFVEPKLAPDILAAVERLRAEVAFPRAVTVGQLCLAWTLRATGVASAIVGATSPAQVDENVAAGDLELDEETWGRVERIMGPFRTRAQS
ncbi:MAG: aldo/keto reductase family protein [Gemmatimonadota bacterium]